MSKAEDFIEMSEIGPVNRSVSASAAKHAEVMISRALEKGLGGNARIQSLPGSQFPLKYIIEIQGNPQPMKVTIEPHMPMRGQY